MLLYNHYIYLIYVYIYIMYYIYIYIYIYIYNVLYIGYFISFYNHYIY